MKLVSLFAAFGSLAVVSAQGAAWSQCGGIGWSGATTCVSGYTCVVSSSYYSQCIPGTAQTTTASATATSTNTVSTSPTTTFTGATPTGSQIRAVQSPVFHFYLQSKSGTPVLGPESSSGYFTISGSISLNNADGSKLYLNVNESASTSYKPLSLGTTATTTDWGLEGDTIITTSPRQLNFIACTTSDSTVYSVYLQEGNDTPAGVTCTLITLHLPCLC